MDAEEEYGSYAGKTIGEVKEIISNIVKSHTFGDKTFLIKSFNLEDFIKNFSNDDFILPPHGPVTIEISNIHPGIWAHIILHQYNKQTYHLYLSNNIFAEVDKIVWERDLNARLSSLESRINALENK